MARSCCVSDVSGGLSLVVVLATSPPPSPLSACTVSFSCFYIGVRIPPDILRIISPVNVSFANVFLIYLYRHVYIARRPLYVWKILN